jgi:hypothetical protein
VTEPAQAHAELAPLNTWLGDEPRLLRSAASVGESRKISPNGRVVPLVPQLVALCAGSAGTSSPRNWPTTRITVDAAG